MPTITETILSTPIDLEKVKKTELENPHALADAVFINFLFYAKKHWSYSASSTSGGKHLLDGSAVAVPCGGLATALKTVMQAAIGCGPKEIELVTIPGYVWTKPEYLCFDPKVDGNIVTLGSREISSEGCIFNQHFYLSYRRKCYDPCLSNTYDVPNQCVRELFPPARSFEMSDGAVRRKLMITEDQRRFVYYLPNVRTPGFSGRWTLFAASKKNLKLALGKALDAKLKTTDNNGQAFAKLYQNLPDV